MQIFDEYKVILQKVYDHIGLIEPVKLYPLQDLTTLYWRTYIPTNGIQVSEFQDMRDVLTNTPSMPHLYGVPRTINEGELFTGVYIKNGDNEVLAIFDNAKRLPTAYVPG
jgi:hypothetical protein